MRIKYKYKVYVSLVYISIAYYDYGGFVCLQIVIDEEFIKILLPTLNPPQVSFHSKHNN